MSYTVEAIRLFDHYHFRIKQLQAATAATRLQLNEPSATGEDPWRIEDYTRVV